MNSVLNGIPDKNRLYKNVHISFAPDDSGLAIGAALNAYNTHNKNKFAQKNFSDNTFFGPEYKSDEIKKILRRYKVSFSEEKISKKLLPIFYTTISFLDGFKEKMEFGPRALGNRSILSNPCYRENKDILNKAVKFRESFRPFASSSAYRMAK